MGVARDFEYEKLIVGIIYHDTELLAEALSWLVGEFGEIEDKTEVFSFSREFSDYYDSELGGEGMRMIVSFKDTVDPARQAEIKIMTNDFEKKHSECGMRRINLDPGFISHGRLMLATTKPTGFRVPLCDGIYTELTLFYARGAWQHFPWSYRDYRSEKVQEFLTRVRRKYLEQRKNRTGSNE